VGAFTVSACPLTVIAWRLGGLTLDDLWWRYLGLGGNRRRGALADYLDGTVPWRADDHNVLAQTLNEALWDLGCSSLAPLRDPDDDLQGVAPRADRRKPDPP
jgi:hypothetical protein